MTSSNAGLPRLDHGLGDLASSYDLVLCDVWGVVHNGVRHHPAAVDALRRFRHGGGTVVMITNAPAPKAQVQARMDRLGVPREAYDAIATSGDVTIGLIVEAGCPPIFGIGPDGEYQLYQEAGRIGPTVPRLVPVAEAEMAICIGLDETGARPEDYDASLTALRERGLDLVCANPDIVVEVGEDLVYCAGSIAERYEAMGGRVIQAGKPFAPIYDLALSLARNLRGEIAKDRILTIGDAMRTDVRGAANQGFASIFITAGIHRAALHRQAAHGDEALDEAALRQFLTDYPIRPDVALSNLRWMR